MKVNELNQEIEKINLEKSVKNAILAIIDLKSEYTMEKQNLIMIAEFEKIRTDIQKANAKFEIQFKMIFWVLSVLVIPITFAIVKSYFF
ncbi:TPA: hypothetical protein EYP45_00580, partial [Candidatus Peregrinibacteria bacterium]|nr:hypothetical protein [Candidatus Peregrinibacteria bacterium]